MRNFPCRQTTGHVIEAVDLKMLRKQTRSTTLEDSKSAMHSLPLIKNQAKTSRQGLPSNTTSTKTHP